MGTLFLCGHWLDANDDKKEKGHSTAGIEMLKDSKIRSFELPHYDEGEMVWKLTGKNPTFVEGSDDILITEPKFTFYGKKGESYIQSERALYQGADSKCLMTGSVYAENLNGFVFTTTKAEFYIKIKKIVFLEPFKVIRDRTELKSEKGFFDMEKLFLKTEGKTIFNHRP